MASALHFAPIDDTTISPEARERLAALAASQRWDRDAEQLSADHAAFRARYGIASGSAEA